MACRRILCFELWKEFRFDDHWKLNNKDPKAVLAKIRGLKFAMSKSREDASLTRKKLSLRNYDTLANWKLFPVLLNLFRDS